MARIHDHATGAGGIRRRVATVLGAILVSGALAAALTGPTARPGDAAVRAAPGGLAQATWSIQKSPAELALNGVDFFGESHGWIVGGEGQNEEKCVILRTDDGGDTWAVVSCPVPLKLLDVSFVSERMGWAVGVQGALIHTEDGGRTWARQDPGTTSRLSSVHFLDERTGWISVVKSAFLLKTVDGGTSWQQVALKKTEDLSLVWFLDPLHGWALGGDGILLATMDGGARWNYLDYGSKRRMYAVAFADVQHGWIAGAEIRGTSDGGQTWHLQPNPDNTVRKLIAFDERAVYAIGDEGLFQYTADGGTTWTREAEGLTHYALADLADAGRTRMWAVGVKGIILRGEASGPMVRPTRTATPPPTATMTSTPTPTPTPRPTATPAGPWARIGPGDGALVLPRGGIARVEVTWGNMPATVDIVAELSGPATFTDGTQSHAASVSRSSGSGATSIMLRAAPDAASGQVFSLQVTVSGTPASRRGTIGWPVWLPRGDRKGSGR
jgi:photosystem II stability/assembly factor-like uncharacterized protein